MTNPVRILLVDDDPNYGALVESALAQAFSSVHVHCSPTEESFHLALEQGDYDLVITECRLPWITGGAVLHLIRSRRPNWPVLMITAAANEKDAIEALGSGLDNYVLKTAGFGLRLQVAASTCLRRVESQMKAARTEKRLGNWVLMTKTLSSSSNGEVTLDGLVEDISERKRAAELLRESEELLTHDTFHDGLTGLPNRALFMDRLRAASERQASAEQYEFALLVIDVDRFQFVNDSLGHIIGDQLIIALAHRLKSCLRPADTLARLGGDEFAILLEEVKAHTDAARIADRIHQELERPFELCGHEIFATASIGIAPSTAACESPEVMLRDADTAMHRAKTKGRARHEVFHASMHTHAVELLKLEGDLRRALEREEFKIYFQPIDTLKIDRSFTTRMPGDGQSAEIVRTIMSLARNLGLSVVAEGVETREQAESLHELHCELAQGFFFHPPLEPDQVSAILRAKARIPFV